jgi:hypothetical protein
MPHVHSHVFEEGKGLSLAVQAVGEVAAGFVALGRGAAVLAPSLEGRCGHQAGRYVRPSWGRRRRSTLGGRRRGRRRLQAQIGGRHNVMTMIILLVVPDEKEISGACCAMLQLL